MAITEAQIDEMASEKMAIRFGAGKELKNLPKYLRPEETLVNMCKGEFAGKSGILVVTDHRALFLESGMFRNTVQDIPFDQVTSVATQTRMLKGEIVIMASGANQVFADIFPKARADEIGSYIRSRMGSRTQAAAPPPASAPAADPALRLQKLQQMKASGMLTESEFQAKKAEIISQM